MKKLYPFILLTALLSFNGCKSDDSGFPTLKKYWGGDDYMAANLQLNSLNSDGKELPNLDNPETAPIFRKITDTTNVTIVANDNQLGIKYRDDYVRSMFDEYRNLVNAYSALDRTDKYKYPQELVEILRFGLVFQIYYIKTANENSMKNADDPNSPEVKSLVLKNKNVIIGNYELYLDRINFEERFNDKAIASYIDGLKYFPRLITEAAPDGDYNSMLDKIDKMSKKTANPLILAELQNIQNLIKSAKGPA